MRWRFPDPGNLREASERAEVVAKIDSWWHAFQTRADDLTALFSRNADWDLPAWMTTHLQSIHPQLMWEFGPAVNTRGHRLVITPEAERHLRPLTQVILQRAPVLPSWEFYSYRLAEDLEQTARTVTGRTGRDVSDIRVRVAQGEHHRIDLVFQDPSAEDANDSSALHTAFVITETLLGEQCLDTWIGAIEVAPASEIAPEPPHFLRLERLHDTVNALIASIHEQLPPDPHFQRAHTATWTDWELKPRPADDYVGQRDLFVATSMNPPQWIAAHSAGMFCSERFSRCGETFCYVKLDGSEDLPAGEFADRSEIEDALDAVLIPEGLGCCIGGGTGLRYSYLDLALLNMDRAIDLIRRRLQAGNVSKRAWILFHDVDLAAEWVGIYEDTPPPPLDVD